MTGFARADGQNEGYAWTVELKSVNGRSLEIRCRVPAGLEIVEQIARAEIPRRLRRGNVNVAVVVTRTASASQLRINRPLLDQLLALATELDRSGRAVVPRLDSLLGIRGVIETMDEADTGSTERLAGEVEIGLRTALDRLVEARLAEGAQLVSVLARQMDEIAVLVDVATASAAAQPAAVRERLKAQVTALLDAVPALSEERLAQEAALLAARCDVREELDRLRAHIRAAQDLLAEGGSIGRRFDFLCQEFNREANTVCSKSSDVGLTRTGLALKAAIEQMREQVQNIE